jgi:hypothetical protein
MRLAKTGFSNAAVTRDHVGCHRRRGAAFALLAGLDGSPVWRVVRVLVVVARLRAGPCRPQE